jgi:hypothetical protein
MITTERAISEEPALEFLQAFDGHIHQLEQGYWLKFEIKRVAATPERPHGLRYSFTLHGPDGERLVGFDNAHGVPPKGSRFRKPQAEHDHWHRTEDDMGQPYLFTSVDRLLTDFEAEVLRVLHARGLSNMVVGESDISQGKPR